MANQTMSLNGNGCRVNAYTILTENFFMIKKHEGYEQGK